MLKGIILFLWTVTVINAQTPVPITSFTTDEPTIEPTLTPTKSQTQDSTESPSMNPTMATLTPTLEPTQIQSSEPSIAPTDNPTVSTSNPAPQSTQQTIIPSLSPSHEPTSPTTMKPTSEPTPNPTYSLNDKLVLGIDINICIEDPSWITDDTNVKSALFDALRYCDDDLFGNDVICNLIVLKDQFTCTDVLNGITLKSQIISKTMKYADSIQSMIAQKDSIEEDIQQELTWAVDKPFFIDNTDMYIVYDNTDDNSERNRINSQVQSIIIFFSVILVVFCGYLCYNATKSQKLRMGVNRLSMESNSHSEEFRLFDNAQNQGYQGLNQNRQML